MLPRGCVELYRLAQLPGPKGGGSDGASEHKRGWCVCGCRERKKDERRARGSKARKRSVPVVQVKGVGESWLNVKMAVVV